MTPAELKTLRESLGLSAQWLADQAGVLKRTVEYWESGKKGRSNIPDDVAALLINIDLRFERAIDETLKLIAESKPQRVVLLRYRSDADLWRFRHDMNPLPATAHAALLHRLKTELQRSNIEAVITWMEPDDYLSWLAGRADNEALRAAWGALQVK